jgi:hypothetical protein
VIRLAVPEEDGPPTPADALKNNYDPVMQLAARCSIEKVQRDVDTLMQGCEN